MNCFLPLRAIALVIGLWSISVAQPPATQPPCGSEMPCGGVAQPVYYQRGPAQPSWIFARSTYTHDPMTGARVAQYERLPAIEPLDDPRMITSRYRRIRTNLRGTDGSVDSTYEVQNWGNGRGGLDAEWERFHDAWKDSYLTGGFYNQQNPGWVGGPGWGWNGGFQQGGFPQGGFPNGGFPNGGWGPNQGFPPGQGFPQGWGQGPGPQGGPWGGNGPHGNNGHGNGPHGGGQNNGRHRGGPNGGQQGGQPQEE